MSPHLVLANARIVLADAVVENGWLAVADGLIVEVGEGSPPERGEDLDGDLLLPGLVELHTDHLENHYVPRPKVFWDPVAAVVSFDGQLATSGITTVLWASGFRPDYSWLDVDVLDAKGMIRHDGGVMTDAPGMYLIGMPFLRRRNSSFIDGACYDAQDLVAALADHLDGVAADRRSIAARGATGRVPEPRSDSLPTSSGPPLTELL